MKDLQLSEIVSSKSVTEIEFEVYDTAKGWDGETLV